MVDALVSGASVERRVGSTPILGTQNDRPQGRVELKGSLAQLVQSICLTSRGSAVRIRQLPQKRDLLQGFDENRSLFLCCKAS